LFRNGKPHRPSKGITRYAGDPTQGPRCSIACATGTVHRNYTHNQNSSQPLEGQVNNLSGIQGILPGITIENGYVITDEDVKTPLGQITPEIKSKCIDVLKVGVHKNLPVIYRALDNDKLVFANSPEHFVHQVFCSALSFQECFELETTLAKYKDLAKLILESTYMSTIYAAREIYEKTGNNKLFLTLVGGGAFKNKIEWVLDAIDNAIAFANVNGFGLDIYVVDYAREPIEEKYDTLYPLDTADGKIVKTNLSDDFFNYKDTFVSYLGIAHYYNPLSKIDGKNGFIGCMLSQAIYSTIIANLPYESLIIPLLKQRGIPICLCSKTGGTIKVISFRDINRGQAVEIRGIIENIIYTAYINSHHLEKDINIQEIKDKSHEILSVIQGTLNIPPTILNPYRTFVTQTDTKHSSPVQLRQQTAPLPVSDVAQLRQQTAQPPVPEIKNWNCGACTFENNYQNKECEICGTPRPRLTARGGQSLHNTYLINKDSFTKLNFYNGNNFK
jgi:hypothetical protein